MRHVSKALIGVGSVIVFVAVGCGGKFEAPGGGSSGSGGSGGSSGTGGSSGIGGSGGTAGSGGSSGHCSEGADCAADSGPIDASPVGCPSTAPTGGETCAPIGIECEYGTSPLPNCNDVWQCSTSGEWKDISSNTGGSCPMGAMRPASYAAASSDHAVCNPEGTFCAYPQGTCICTDDPGGLPLAGGPQWGCTPVTKGCPAAPPELGTPCTTPAATLCDYGGCSGGVDMQCTGGYWAIATMVGCPA